ncbi:MAG TPA: GtrA family protein [Prolixibacteraceae bacterium]|nr:GtrA family protein [Prolixibacteraceae bacterium]
MSSILEETGHNIRRITAFFYPPFRKYMTLQFFLYGVTGAANLVFDWVLYFVLYNYVLQQRDLRMGFVTLSSHIGTMAIKIPVVLCTGFLLQRYVTFFQSEVVMRKQLFRYSIVFAVNLLINYFGLKLLVDNFGFWPSPSNVTISIVTVIVSYFSQKWFTFQTSPPRGELQRFRAR